MSSSILSVRLSDLRPAKVSPSGIREAIVKRMGDDPATGEKFTTPRDNLRASLLEIIALSKKNGCITGKIHQIAESTLKEFDNEPIVC